MHLVSYCSAGLYALWEVSSDIFDMKTLLVLVFLFSCPETFFIFILRSLWFATYLQLTLVDDNSLKLNLSDAIQSHKLNFNTAKCYDAPY